MVAFSGNSGARSDSTHDDIDRCRPSGALCFISAFSVGLHPRLYAAVPPGLTEPCNFNTDASGYIREVVSDAFPSSHWVKSEESKVKKLRRTRTLPCLESISQLSGRILDAKSNCGSGDLVRSNVCRTNHRQLHQPTHRETTRSV